MNGNQFLRFPSKTKAREMCWNSTMQINIEKEHKRNPMIPAMKVALGIQNSLVYGENSFLPL